MVTKIAALRSCASCGDWIGALRIAAKFPRLGDHEAAITRGWSAHQRPDFYREIGHDPSALVAAGVQAIKERYSL